MLVERRVCTKSKYSQLEFVIHIPTTLREHVGQCSIGLRTDQHIVFCNGSNDQNKKMTPEEFAWFFLASVEDQQEFILKHKYLGLPEKIKKQKVLLNRANMTLSWIIHSLNIIHDYMIGNIEMELTQLTDRVSVYCERDIAKRKKYEYKTRIEARVDAKIRKSQIAIEKRKASQIRDIIIV